MYLITEAKFLAEDIKLFKIKAPRIAQKRKAGQFVIIRIDENGELLDAMVSKSSGSTILDLASVDIIQRASPFDEFPAPMANEYDTVAFEYKFLFTEQLVRND